MHKLARELLGYAVASAVAFAVDLAVLEALVRLAGWHYLVAASASFTAGAAVAYLLSVRYVFSYRQLDDPRLEFAGFVGLGVAGLIVNAAVLYATVGRAGLGLVAAKVVAAGGTFLTNFTLRRRILFVPARAAQ